MHVKHSRDETVTKSLRRSVHNWPCVHTIPTRNDLKPWRYNRNEMKNEFCHFVLFVYKIRGKSRTFLKTNNSYMKANAATTTECHRHSCEQPQTTDYVRLRITCSMIKSLWKKCIDSFEVNLKVPMSWLGILHIYNIWNPVIRMAIYLVVRKFYLRRLFGC